MSSDAPRARDGTQLDELRVLEGPNRFFTRPAVKLEFSSRTPGAAARAAHRAGERVRQLHEMLHLPPPRVTFRRSQDDLRAIVAYPWRRRIISQSIGSSAARIALGTRRLQTELAGLALCITQARQAEIDRQHLDALVAARGADRMLAGAAAGDQNLDAGAIVGCAK